MNPQQRHDLAALMRRTGGIATTRQAAAIGIGARALSRACVRGEIVRLRQGTYAPAGMPLTWEHQLAADIAACRRRAAASYSAALRVHRLRVPGLATRREITVEGSSCPAVRGDVVVHRTLVLPNGDLLWVGNIPVTAAERTLIDMSGQLAEASLLTLVDEALMRGLAHRGILLQRACALRPGRPAASRIIAVCDADGEARFRSGLERDGAQLLRRAGVRDLRFNVVPERAPAAGLTDVVSEVDNLIVDWDGLRFHAGPGARQRDNIKGNAAALGGYTHLRFTWADQRNRPDHVMALSRRAVGLT